MKSFNRLVAMVALVTTMSAASAADRPAGQFLKLGAGARAMALGNASVALNNDSFAAVNNPAGLGLSRSVNVEFNQQELFEEVRNLGGVLRTPMPLGSMSLIYSQVNYGDIPGADNAGAISSPFNSTDWFGGAGYGMPVGEHAAVGVTAKFVSSEIEFHRTHLWAADAGVMVRDLWSRRINLGLAVQNATVSGNYNFEGEKESLPVVYRLGGQITPLRLNRLSFSYELDFPKGQNRYSSLGLEFNFLTSQHFALVGRAGYSGIRSHTGSTLDSGGSAGLGIRLGAVGLDWAWVPYGDLGMTQIVSLGLRFGADRDSMRAAPATAAAPANAPVNSTVVPAPTAEPSKTNARPTQELPKNGSPIALYLKNGTVVRGTLIEHTEDHYALETTDGWTKVQVSDVEIAK